MAGRGYNAFHGFDAGPLPPGFQPAQPAAQHPYPYGWPQQAMAIPVMTPQVPVVPVMNGYPYPYGYGQTHPAVAPVVNPNFPGIQ